MAEQEQAAATGAAEAEAIDLGDYMEHLEKDFRVKKDDSERLQALVRNLALAAQARSETTAISSNAIKSVKSLIAGIDKMLTEQMNEVLHAPEVREIEGTWRGLWYLVNNTETDQKLKIRVINISKTELADTLEDFEGQMWDQSPVFRKVYTDEYSMFGGEPFGCLVGGYEFSNHPKDVGLLRNLSGICASAHTPFIAAASPRLFRMDSWQELPNPQDLQQIVSNPAYASWQSLRESEDARYIGLTMPRVLARLPYGAETVPVKGFAFEEEVQGDHEKYTWMNAAFPMGVNINRSHKLFGWGTQIRGVENGGAVLNLPVHTFPTDDGSVAMKCPTEVAIDDRREAELAKLGLMPILHRKNTDIAAFIGAHSLQDDEARAGRLVDPDAQANERLSREPALPLPGVALRALPEGHRAGQDRLVQGTLRHAGLADGVDQPLRPRQPGLRRRQGPRQAPARRGRGAGRQRRGPAGILCRTLLPATPLPARGHQCFPAAGLRTAVPEDLSIILEGETRACHAKTDRP